MFLIRIKHLFINICNIFYLVGNFQVSQAYNYTDFTFVLNILILTLFDMF